MKRALYFVDSGRVVQIVGVGQDFPVHPSMAWADCPDDADTETHEHKAGVVQKIAAPAVSLADHKAGSVAAIKAEAGRRILARYPQHTQANMTARAVELVSENKASGAEWAAIQAAWAWVKSVRAESARVEAAILAAANAAGVDAAVAGIQWPA